MFYSWRFLIPYYFKFPFPDVKKVRKDVYIMRQAVESIISQKSEALQQGKSEWMSYINYS